MNDFQLISNFTPGLFNKYSDIYATQPLSDSLGTDEPLLAVPPSAVFNPLKDTRDSACLIPSTVPNTSNEDLTLLGHGVDDLAVYYTTAVEDVNGLQGVQNVATAVQSSQKSTSSSFIFSSNNIPAASSSKSQGIGVSYHSHMVPSSQHIKLEQFRHEDEPEREVLSSIGHGSGGIVTIVKRKADPAPHQLSEPLAKLLSPLTPPYDDERVTDPAAKQTVINNLPKNHFPACLPQSDDEEITDDFNWDKLI